MKPINPHQIVTAYASATETAPPAVSEHDVLSMAQNVAPEINALLARVMEEAKTAPKHKPSEIKSTLGTGPDKYAASEKARATEVPTGRGTV